jgi:hypothetical protein
MLSHVQARFSQEYERPAESEKAYLTVCADLLNETMCMLQTTICSTFRQGEAHTPDNYFEAEDWRFSKAVTEDVEGIEQVLDALLFYLRIDSTEFNQDDWKDIIASALNLDIRMLHMITALLHEICAKKVDSAFIGVVRTQVFYTLVQNCIRLALQRFQHEQAPGAASFDLTELEEQPSSFTSPMRTLLDGFHLAPVFEHLLVCMRHLLVQAMYVPLPEADDEKSPWAWDAQEQMKIHLEAMTWLPEIIRIYSASYPGLQVEVVRYLCAIATFVEAPEAHGKRTLVRGVQVIEATFKTGPGVGFDVWTAAAPNRRLLRHFSLTKPEVQAALLDGLGSFHDCCTCCLALLAVANLLEYERSWVNDTESELDSEKLRRLCDFVPAVVELLKVIPQFPKEVGIACKAYGTRFFITCLAFDSVGGPSGMELAAEVFTSGAWEVMNTLFEHFFQDQHFVEDAHEYVDLLEGLVTYVRAWICRGCLNEEAIIKHAPDDKHNLQILGEALETTRLINFLVSVALKLTLDCERPLPNDDQMKDSLYEDSLKTYQSLFKRQEERGLKIHWRKLNTDRFNELLEEMHNHRYKRSGVFDDTTVVNTLYGITKLAFHYTRQHFPDYLLEVAYGPREQYCLLQDVAAICCAIIFTAKTDEGTTSSATANLAGVIKNFSDFMHNISQNKHTEMQLWHFRTLTSWSTKPKVLDDISRHGPSLKFVIDSTKDQILGRYAFVFAHNLSVLRPVPVVETKGLLSTLCEAYRLYPPGSEWCRGDNAERRELRRLCISAIRNCTYGTDDLNKLLSDQDMQSITELVDTIEQADVSLYMATLCNLTSRIEHKRIALKVGRNVPLIDFLVKQLVRQHRGPVQKTNLIRNWTRPISTISTCCHLMRMRMTTSLKMSQSFLPRSASGGKNEILRSRCSSCLNLRKLRSALACIVS